MGHNPLSARLLALIDGAVIVVACSRQLFEREDLLLDETLEPLLDLVRDLDGGLEVDVLTCDRWNMTCGQRESDIDSQRGGAKQIHAFRGTEALEVFLLRLESGDTFEELVEMFLR